MTPLPRRDSLLWDATVLYGLTAPINEQMIEAVENYYLTWWNGGMAIKMFLHIVVSWLSLRFVHARADRFRSVRRPADAGAVLLARGQVGPSVRDGLLLLGRFHP